MIYYRVECIDMKEDHYLGGYVNIIFATLAHLLGVDQEELTSKMLSKVKPQDNFYAYRLLVLMKPLLLHLPIPEVYISDQDNYVCLYKKKEFKKVKHVLEEINYIIGDETNGRAMLVAKKFKIRDDEIIYEDDFQIVIGQSTYEERNGGYYLLEDV